MEKLKFMAKGQKLIRLEIKPIYSGVRNYMEAEFILNHSWYNITPLVAQFKKDEKIFHVTLNNGKCTVPWEVLENAGTIEISLTGGNLLVTNPVKVTVNNSGAEGGLVPTEASNSLYSEIMAKLNSIEEDWLNCKSLLAEYEQNISDSETAVENKITDFETKSDELSGKINEINVLAEKCKSDSQTAQNLYEEVKEKIENARKTIDTLVEKITLAQNTKSSLEESISNSNSAKAVLESTITRAENIKTQLKLEDCIAENERAEKNIEQLESDNFNAEEILYGVENLKKYLGYVNNGLCFFAKFNTENSTIEKCIDNSVVILDLSNGYNGMNVKAIGDYAFTGCGSLTQVDFGNDLISIGADAFNSSGITEDIVITPNIQTIGEGAFRNIKAKIYNLTDIEIDADNIVKTTSEGSCGESTSYKIAGEYMAIRGSGVTEDYSENGQQYNEHINDIKSIYIQEGVTGLGSRVFCNFSNVTKAEIPETVETIGAYAMAYTTNINDINTIPKSITTIGPNGLASCGIEGRLVLPKLSNIGGNAFRNCSKITNFEFTSPDLKGLSSSCFYYCRGLTGTIEIPKNVETIGSLAFYNCNKIESIVIPSATTTISPTAFSGCSKVTTIKIDKETDSIANAPWGAEGADIIWK